MTVPFGAWASAGLRMLFARVRCWPGGLGEWDVVAALEGCIGSWQQTSPSVTLKVRASFSSNVSDSD